MQTSSLTKKREHTSESNVCNHDQSVTIVPLLYIAKVKFQAGISVTYR